MCACVRTAVRGGDSPFPDGICHFASWFPTVTRHWELAALSVFLAVFLYLNPVFALTNHYMHVHTPLDKLTWGNWDGLLSDLLTD